VDGFVSGAQGILTHFSAGALLGVLETLTRGAMGRGTNLCRLLWREKKSLSAWREHRGKSGTESPKAGEGGGLVWFEESRLCLSFLLGSCGLFLPFEVGCPKTVRRIQRARDGRFSCLTLAFVQRLLGLTGAIGINCGERFNAVPLNLPFLKWSPPNH